VLTVSRAAPSTSRGTPSLGASRGRREIAARAVLILLAVAVGLGLGWRAVQRHDALQTGAEDLGFTDQILWNFLRGQVFRFTTYQHAEFVTDVDLKAIRRPDSLLAFHVEPILVLLAPLYLVVPDVRAILWLQGVALALAAIPAYRLARRRLGHPLAGLAFATVYLLSPLGQWAALADFHSVTLAAPLLMLAIDALDAGHTRLFLLAGLLAAMTKEEVGLVVAGLGLLGLLRCLSLRIGWLPALGLGPAAISCPDGWRRLGRASLAAVVLGIGWSIFCVSIVIPYYSGGTISPFTVRYAELGGSPLAALRTFVEHPSTYLHLVTRPEALGYLGTLLLVGGWLVLLAPELLVPAVPVLLLNILSASPWMSAGRAHYSASILPLVVAMACIAAQRFVTLHSRFGGEPASRPALGVVSFTAVLLSLVAYRQAGIGPLVDGLPPPVVSRHAELGRQLAASIPKEASVAASSALYPHLSQRAEAYLFPTVRDAEYVLVDVSGGSYPAGPGGIYQRLQELRTGGDYGLLAAEDGFILMKRGVAGEQAIPDRFFDFARANNPPDASPLASFHDGAIELLSARLVPQGEIGPRGPLATLETVWQIRGPVPERPRPAISVRFSDGTVQTFGNLPVLWWYPPEAWHPGEPVRIDVPGLTAHQVIAWEGSAPLDPSPGADRAQ
jgi:uncharacterized membrane protein